MTEDYYICDRSSYTFPKEGWEIIDVDASTGVKRTHRRSGPLTYSPDYELDHALENPKIVFSPGVKHCQVILQGAENGLCIARECLKKLSIDPPLVFSDHISCEAVESGATFRSADYYLGKMRWRRIEALDQVVDFSRSNFERVEKHDFLRHKDNLPDLADFDMQLPIAAEPKTFSSWSEYKSLPSREKLANMLLCRNLYLNIGMPPIFFLCFSLVYVRRDLAKYLHGAKKAGMKPFGGPRKVYIQGA
jgi:hypothetical protein